VGRDPQVGSRRLWVGLGVTGRVREVVGRVRTAMAQVRVVAGRVVTVMPVVL